MDNSITKREETPVTKADSGNPIRRVTTDTPKNQDMVIVDLSGSMEDPAFQGKSRYDCVLEAITPYTGQVQVLAFADHVREMAANNLPRPGTTDLGYGTNMEKAFKMAQFLEPIHVLLMSDGEPGHKSAVLEEATSLAAFCIIDVLYIGPTNRRASDFMRQIAEIGRGRFFDFAIDSQSPALLESKIGSLLALPSPETIEL